MNINIGFFSADINGNEFLSLLIFVGSSLSLTGAPTELMDGILAISAQAPKDIVLCQMRLGRLGVLQKEFLQLPRSRPIPTSP